MNVEKFLRIRTLREVLSVPRRISRRVWSIANRVWSRWPTACLITNSNSCLNL